MKKLHVKRESLKAVSPLSRIVMLVLGAILIGSVTLQDGFLGWITLLPLLAIYPIFVSLTGFSPVKAVWDVYEQWLYGRSINKHDGDFNSKMLPSSS